MEVYVVRWPPTRPPPAQLFKVKIEILLLIENIPPMFCRGPDLSPSNLTLTPTQNINYDPFNM